MAGKGDFRSYECPRCRRTFSPIVSLRRCVVCRDADGHLLETVPSDSLPIWNAERAKKLKDAYTEHERRYELHKARRKKLGYPDPDELGRMQGRRLAQELRDLEEAYGASA